jgi:hypothetical protein
LQMQASSIHEAFQRHVGCITCTLTSGGAPLAVC